MSLQVSHSEKILNSIKNIQKAILEKEPQMESFMVDAETGHLTLMILNLKGNKKCTKSSNSENFGDVQVNKINYCHCIYLKK